MVEGLFRTVEPGERRDVMSSIANRIGINQLETIIVLPRTECWVPLHSFARTERWRGALALLFRDGRWLTPGRRDRLTRLSAWQRASAHGELELRRRGGNSLRPGFCGGWVGYAPTREFRGEWETVAMSVSARTITAKPWAEGRVRATGTVTQDTPDQEETDGNLLSPSHLR